jgi:hypothetical protein
MKIVHLDDVVPSVPVRKGFRGGDIQFRDLLLGKEGEPDNFGLQWVEVENAYHAPRHRHNFEQIRIMIEGSFGFGQGLVQEAGSVGYFCEGTYYTQSADSRSVTLLLQVGGPSQSGFMSREQLRRGIEQLALAGSFHDGVYTWLDSSGKKHNQDSYEAAWEKIHDRALSYPKPQYSTPILMRPESFQWVPASQGVWSKSMGSFTEYGLRIAQLKIDGGRHYEFQPAGQKYLIFCEHGQGTVGGSSYLRWTSIECGQTDRLSFHAKTDSVFWLLGLPVFV